MTGPEQLPQSPAAQPPAEARHGVGERWRMWWRLRRQATELRWSFLFRGVMHAGLVTQVVLLHVRYTCGYLATGFLVSAPIQLIGASHMEWDDGRIWKSMLLGGLFGLPFVALIPFTNVDWGRMRIPEFKHLELAFCRWALWASIGLVVLALFAEAAPDSRLLDLRVAWVNLVLMFFAWVRVKVNMLMFREFYTLKPGDELVISLPLGYERPDLAAGEPPVETSLETPTPDAEEGAPAPAPPSPSMKAATEQGVPAETTPAPPLPAE